MEITNRAFRGAYRKGYEAAIAGKCVYDCPYNEAAVSAVGGGRLVPTFERAFARYWKEGFERGLVAKKKG